MVFVFLSSSSKQLYDEFLVDLFAHLIYPSSDYKIEQPSSSSAAPSAKTIGNDYDSYQPLLYLDNVAAALNRNTVTTISSSDSDGGDASGSVGSSGAIISNTVLRKQLEDLMQQQQLRPQLLLDAEESASGMALAAVILFAAFVVLFVYTLYVALPDHICDRRKIQFFEFKLRLTNEYLCDLMEPLIGAERRNKVLRFLTALLFSFQPASPKWCRVKNVRIAGVPCRVYSPQGAHRKSDACLIFIHGGGWCIMRAKYYDTTLIPLVRRLGITLISIDYYLSPEATFGTAIQQCESVAHAVYYHIYKDYNIDPNRIGIMGDSAGGNLSAVLAQRALRQGRPDIFKCHVLVYPVIHMLDFLSPSYRYYYNGYKGAGLLNPRLMARWFLMYLGIEATPKNVKAVTKNQHVSSEIRSDPKVMSLLDHSRLPDHIRDVKGVDEKSTSPYLHPPDEKLARRVSKYLKDPEFCPILGENLRGLAPALVVTAGVDILRDEGVHYAQKLKDESVAAEWRHYPAAFHGVIHMPYSKQRDQIYDDVADYLRAHLINAKSAK